jgi:hypothetical protein
VLLHRLQEFEVVAAREETDPARAGAAKARERERAQARAGADARRTGIGASWQGGAPRWGARKVVRIS